jgi:hypothetical protein
MSRIHFLVDGEDKLRYEGQAAREGMSLGAWLREAAEERYRASQATQLFSSVDELDTFFAECDSGSEHGGPSREPDWAEHQRVLDSSRRGGLDAT